MSHNQREDKKYVAPCNYKTVASSNLYLPGPACLQPSFERSKYDMNFYNNSSATMTSSVPTTTSSSISNLSNSMRETYKRRECKCGQK